MALEIGFRIEDSGNYASSCILDYLLSNIGLNGKLEDVPLCLEYFSLDQIDKSKITLEAFLRNTLRYNIAVDEDDPIVDLVDLLRQVAVQETLPLELLKRVNVDCGSRTDCVLLWFNREDIVKC